MLLVLGHSLGGKDLEHLLFMHHPNQYPLQTNRHTSPNSKRFESQDSSWAALRERNCVSLTEEILSRPFESYK